MFNTGKIGAYDLLRYPFSSSNALTEILDYQNRITENGGTISASSLQAISNFVNTLKLNNIWDKCLEIAPYAGDNLNAALVKLKYPNGVQSTLTNIGFLAGDYSETTGLTGDNTESKYLNTGFIPANHLASSLDTHLSIYARNSSALVSGGATTANYIGGSAGGNFRIERNGSSIRGLCGSGAEMIASVANNNLRGHLLLSTISANNGFLANNGSSVATDTSFTVNSKSTVSTTVFGDNRAGDVVVNISNLICAFHSIGYGLNPTQASTFYAAVQVSQTSLGRQV